MAQVFKSPIEQAQDLTKTPSTREKWNKYLKYGFRGSNPDKWNSLIEDVLQELPFKTSEEQDKWVELGSRWKGEPEWTKIAEQALKRIDDYDLQPDQVRELKTRFKGKDYDTAIGRLLQGDAFGDILNGIIPYNK